MKRIQKFILQFFPPAQSLKAGMYHFQSSPDSPQPLRYHLRVEPGGEGILIINAHTVLHLNQTAAEYTYHLLQQTPVEEVSKNISQRYRISKEQAGQDYKNLKDRIETLVSTPDLDPETFLDIERSRLYSAAMSAPYRLDCAITYLLEEEKSDLAPLERVTRELPADSWKSMLEKAWNAGIPHVIFTGGEATLRPDLPDLINIAGNLGMVTGLLTNGLRLSQPEYLRTLLQTGLDHIFILLDHANTDCWKAIEATIKEDISLCVHVTLSADMIDQFPQILQKLNLLGIKNISLSVADPTLKSFLKSAQEQISEAGLKLIWDFPVPYSKFNPVAFELEGSDEDLPQGAGKAWLYIEPDGDVLMSQGVGSPVGNLLVDSWEQIWKNVMAQVA